MAYIPIEHQKYDILPFCRSKGGEVFSYDSELASEICELLPCREIEQTTPDGAELQNVDYFSPWGFDSYEEYDEYLDSLISEHGTVNDELNHLGKLMTAFKEDIMRRNVKENWSVVRYVGESTDGIGGFTNGRYYYWPCSIENPEYEGIIDDQEFTSYLAWVNKEQVNQSLENGVVTDFVNFKRDWEIAEDPTGMAERFLNSLSFSKQ